MEISVRHIDKYSEVVAHSNNLVLSSGLLNYDESIQYAKEFMSAAEELLYGTGKTEVAEEIHCIMRALDRK